jgi:hypothetical protein
MAAPFSELPKDDMGRDDPRRMCFIDDMGVPEELIFFIWQASRRAALEHCADILANVTAHGGDMNAAIGLVRALAKETNNG